MITKAIEIMETAAGGESQFFEWKFCRMDGSLFDAEVSLSRFFINEQVYLQAIIRDITARKQNDEALARRVQQQALIATLGQTALADPDLRHLFDTTVEADRLHLRCGILQSARIAPK